MRRWLVLALVLLARPAAAVDRVVSLNLCTDQMLVLLAPGNVAGLSVLARDPVLSFVAAQAGGMPIAHTSAEAVLRLRPDLVLAARYGAQATLSVLEQEGLRVIRVDLPIDWPGVRAMTRELAALLDVPARGEALVAGMDALLAIPARTDNAPAPTDRSAPELGVPDIPGSADRGIPRLDDPGIPGADHGIRPAEHVIPGLVPGTNRGTSADVDPQLKPGDDGRIRTAIALEPRLYLAGPDSILGAAMRAAGLTSATNAPRITLETLVRQPPDLLVVPMDPAFPSLATDLLDHPALRGIPRRIVPPNLTICPGPFSAQAVALLRS